MTVCSVVFNGVPAVTEKTVDGTAVTVYCADAAGNSGTEAATAAASGSSHSVRRREPLTGARAELDEGVVLSPSGREAAAPATSLARGAASAIARPEGAASNPAFPRTKWLVDGGKMESVGAATASSVFVAASVPRSTHPREKSLYSRSKVTFHFQIDSRSCCHSEGEGQEGSSSIASSTRTDSRVDTSPTLGSEECSGAVAFSNSTDSSSSDSVVSNTDVDSSSAILQATADDQRDRRRRSVDTSCPDSRSSTTGSHNNSDSTPEGSPNGSRGSSTRCTRSSSVVSSVESAMCCPVINCCVDNGAESAAYCPPTSSSVARSVEPPANNLSSCRQPTSCDNSSTSSSADAYVEGACSTFVARPRKGVSALPISSTAHVSTASSTLVKQLSPSALLSPVAPSSPTSGSSPCLSASSSAHSSPPSSSSASSFSASSPHASDPDSTLSDGVSSFTAAVGPSEPTESLGSAHADDGSAGADCSATAKCAAATDCDAPADKGACEGIATVSPGTAADDSSCQRHVEPSLLVSTAAAKTVASELCASASLTCGRSHREPVLSGAEISGAGAGVAGSAASARGPSGPLSPAGAAADVQPDDRFVQYSLEDRHLVWRKNAALHYAGVLSYRLEWPSMTVEFLSPANPSASSFSYRNSSSAAALYSSSADVYVSHRVLLGTCTSGEEKNYLTIAEVRWPSPSFEEDPLRCETYSGFIPPRARARGGMYSMPSAAMGGGVCGDSRNASAGGGSGGVGGNCSGGTGSSSVGSGGFVNGCGGGGGLPLVQAPSLEIRARILHPGDLIRATHMPQNFFNIITLNDEGLCMYWNFARHPSFPTAEQTVAKPQLLLVPGYGATAAATAKAQAAAWSAADEGHLFTCTDTGLVCLYDLTGSMQSRQRLSSSSINGSSNTNGSSSSGGSSSLAAEDRGSHSLKRFVYGGDVTLAESTPEVLPVASYCIQTSNSGDSGGAIAASSCLGLNDIKVHPRYSAVVGTAGEDGCMRLLDTRLRRRGGDAAVATSEAAATGAAAAGRKADVAEEAAGGNDGSTRHDRSGSSWKERRSVSVPKLDFSHVSGAATTSDSMPPAAAAGEGSRSSLTALNCLSFNKHYENLAAVGSACGRVLLFDLRLLQKPLLVLSHHTEEITCVHFSPCSGALLASGSADGDVALWNLAQQQFPRGFSEWEAADNDEYFTCCRCRGGGGQFDGVGGIQQCPEASNRATQAEARREAEADSELGDEDEGDKRRGEEEADGDVRCVRHTAQQAETATCNVRYRDASSAGNVGGWNWDCAAAGGELESGVTRVSTTTTTSGEEVGWRGDAIVAAGETASDSAKVNAAAAAGVVVWRGAGCCVCGGSRRRRTRQKELMFVHAGHAGGVSDFAWSAEAAAAGGFSNGSTGRRSEAAAEGRAGQLLGVSVGWDNRVQVWQPSEHYLMDMQESTAPCKKKRLLL